MNSESNSGEPGRGVQGMALPIYKKATFGHFRPAIRRCADDTNCRLREGLQVNRLYKVSDCLFVCVHLPALAGCVFFFYLEVFNQGDTKGIITNYIFML